MRKNIAVISNSGLNFQHSCVYNLISLILASGHEVDYFAFHDKSENVIREQKGLKFVLLSPKEKFKIFKIRSLYVKHSKQKIYFYTIFVDNPSLFIYLLLFRNIKNSIYSQLEITDKRKCKSFRDKLLKLSEDFASKRVDYIITQDIARAAYCAGEFNIGLSKFLIFPNSPMKANYLRQEKMEGVRKKHNLPIDKIIIGYIGMVDEYTFPQYLVDQVESITDYCFFIHTHKKNHPYYKEIKQKLRGKVIFSDDYIEPSELSELYSCFDIGLAIGDYSTVINKYTTVNQDLVGLSVGKLNWYFSLGIPAIYAPKISWEHLEALKCGVPFSKDSDLSEAILKINMDYSLYSKSCFHYYNQYMDPVKAFLKIEKILF